MVPLYVYPGAAWDTVIEGANYAQTVAIINPQSGPKNPVPSAYVTYMQKMTTNNVDMIGYVYTSYGLRSMSQVKADIDTYVSLYPLVKGIFLDEGAADASLLPFYQELYTYIMSQPGYEYVVINPGIIPDIGYLAVSTQIVSFENYGSVAGSVSAPSWGSCSNKNHFVAMAHTTTSDNMQNVVNQLYEQNYFGYIYVTDGVGGCCTYNALCSYYNTAAEYIGSL